MNAHFVVILDDGSMLSTAAPIVSMNIPDEGWVTCYSEKGQQGLVLAVLNPDSVRMVILVPDQKPDQKVEEKNGSRK